MPFADAHLGPVVADGHLVLSGSMNSRAHLAGMGDKAREYVMPFVTAKGASPTAHAWERNVLGKNYPTFAPIGPVIVTRDEAAAPLSYHMETLVNGAVMQSSTQQDLVFGPAEMVSYFSQFHILSPGDIISMGSPPGVGMARKPPVFLKPGDLVEVRIDWLGTLVNTVGERQSA